MKRADWLRSETPQLIADVWLYASVEGGRRTAAAPGWGCPCFIRKVATDFCYDGWPLLGEEWISPGEKRRLGWVFLLAGADVVMKQAGKFYLWEAGFIGEATVIDA